MIELLDLIARWVHVIAGIMWVGNSMLFNWLDRNLRPSAVNDVYGDIWLLHSGGFYFVEKNKGERRSDGTRMHPEPLHWFKWQAYTAWISGALLLVVVYYLGGRALLVDPQVSAITPMSAVLVAVGTIVLGFSVYDALWRVLGTSAPRVAGVVSMLLLIGAVELLLHTLSGRAAFVHTGALLATIMAGNVALTIIPSQRDLTAALREGREPSQAIADKAKTRSIHNNYLTFPAIVLMVSGHFPSLYSHGNADVILLLLIAAGAGVRHVMNIRFTWPRCRPALAAVIVVAILALTFELGVGPFAKPNGVQQAGAPSAAFDSALARLPAIVTFADARRVLDRRCLACHSSTPSDLTFGPMPAGVSFDSASQVHVLAARIRERAVVQRTMPPANKTRMTDVERAILAKWLQQGASVIP